jgi:hypothetical protein
MPGHQDRHAMAVPLTQMHLRGGQELRFRPLDAVSTPPLQCDTTSQQMQPVERGSRRYQICRRQTYWRVIPSLIVVGPSFLPTKK